MQEHSLTRDLEKALRAGYIDASTVARQEFKPKLLLNDVQNKTKVLTTILSELRSCDEFAFSVAFVTNSGVEVIIDALKELEHKNIKGRILASSYQNFTEPRALRRLLRFPNIELKIQTENNFHAKGYIFKHGDGHTLIVGSSNLTQNALCANNEWNLRVTSFAEGSIVSDIRNEFDRQFASATVVDEDWLQQYSRIYRAQRIAQINARISSQEELAAEYPLGFRPSPNTMQKEALEALQVLRAEGQDRALLISATGTGKTYLSAFDASAFDAKRVLFVIHRENIARAAMKTFRTVFGNSRTMGFYGGSEYDMDSDFIFTTVQTMSRPDHYLKFDPDHFDYICIDEVHRSGAESYQRLINYFTPKFLLGMSATPERTDGIDIFKTFNYNIAYEIRLQDALDQNMLSPFHYHGVSDLTVNGELIEDETEFRYLVSEERVKHIYDVTRFYGCDHGRIKGLIFCSRKEEALELEHQLNAKELSTKALTGEHSEAEREHAIQLLETDDPDNYLDYIITVDIFNEGVDIPSVNQVVMLRPTQSAIIFVQQLGRGLRKLADKEYVVVIDFIGNYKKSFLIPIALSGDKTYNKDNVRRYVSEGSRVVPGCSTIDFDEIAKERIYASIDEARFNDIELIKTSYKNLKARLGRIPTLMDFDQTASIDPVRIFDNKNIGCYYTFLKKYEKEYTIRFTDEEENVLQFISRKLAPGKRVHELVMLKLMLEDGHQVFARFAKAMKDEYDLVITDTIRTNVINFMTNQFPSGGSAGTYKSAVLLQADGDDYSVSPEFAKMLENEAFRAEIQTLVEFGLYRNRRDYAIRYADTFFTLNAKYTYEDVCRILNWEKGEVALNIGGYKYDARTKTYPVFINYDKAEDVVETQNYNDRFESPRRLIAISKSNRTVESGDVQTALHADELGVAMHLFVRKNKDDKETSKEFYYLGKLHATGETQEFTMPGTSSGAVEIAYQLETPVQESLYEYLVG